MSTAQPPQACRAQQSRLEGRGIAHGIGDIARHGGFGLLESLAVLALAAVVAGLAAPNLQAQLHAWRLEAASGEVARMIRLARQQSATRRLPLRLDADLQSMPRGCLLLHTGAAGACVGCVGAVSCTGDARLIARSSPWPAGVQLQASAASLLWHPASGTVSPTGTYRLRLASPGAGWAGTEVQQVVNILGRVRSCSTDHRIRGHVAC